MIGRALLLCAALLLVGCNGGTVDRQDLSKDSGSLDSMACEGMVIAQGVARGRVTATFTREQSAVLRVQSSNLEDALRRRPVANGLEARVRAQADRAGRLAALLQRLHDRAADRATGRELAHTFKKIGMCA